MTESRAKDVVNQILLAALPSIRLAVGEQIAQKYEQRNKDDRKSISGGGVHIDALYGGLKVEPHEVVEELSIQLHKLKVDRSVAQAFLSKAFAPEAGDAAAAASMPSAVKSPADTPPLQREPSAEDEAAAKIASLARGFRTRADLKLYKETIEQMREEALAMREPLAPNSIPPP